MSLLTSHRWWWRLPEGESVREKVRTIEEIVGETETDLRFKDGLVMREENTTCSQVVSVEHRG
jgi:hypothetical protein